MVERVSSQKMFIDRLIGGDTRILIPFGLGLAALGAIVFYTMYDVVRIGGVGRLFVAANDEGSYLNPEDPADPSTLCDFCLHPCGYVNNEFDVNHCGCKDRNPLQHCLGCIAS